MSADLEEREQMTFAWPARLARDDEGRVQVRFPDFSEALTDGADETEALAEAADCLAEAVAARIVDGEALPSPSPGPGNAHMIPVPPLLAYKAALHMAMRRRGLTKSALACRLGVDEKEVRRLLDPRYRGTRLDRLDAALAACGLAARITVVSTSSHPSRRGPASRSAGADLRPRRTSAAPQ